MQWEEKKSEIHVTFAEIEFNMILLIDRGTNKRAETLMRNFANNFAVKAAKKKNMETKKNR